MRFVKMQGTGNDFLLVEAKDEQRDWGALARAMCDRHYGAGADGLMLVLPSQGADVRMRLFNADGSEAEARIKTETHRLARHQNAWFKADDARIRWLDAGEDTLEEAERLVESEMGLRRTVAHGR